MEVVVDDEKGNSVDAFIRNGYSAEEMHDHEYLSDNSLRMFLRDLKDKGITGDDPADLLEESKSHEVSPATIEKQMSDPASVGAVFLDSPAEVSKFGVDQDLPQIGERKQQSDQAANAHLGSEPPRDFKVNGIREELLTKRLDFARKLDDRITRLAYSSQG